MKKILLIVLILGIILSTNFSAFSDELQNDKITMSKIIFGNDETLDSLVIYDIKQKHHAWQFTAEDAGNILIFAKNVVLTSTQSKEEIKDENKYLKIDVYNELAKSIYISYDGYVTTYNTFTNEMLGVKYKIENFVFFKNNIDKLLTTQHIRYGTYLPSRNQSTKISDWAMEYYEYANEKDILPPFLQFGFLTDNITREQFSDLLFKFLEKTLELKWSEDSKTPFLDTENKNIITLYNEDIIKGKSDTNFAPNDFITRQEAATLLYRAAEYLEMKSTDKSNKVYKDDGDISDWAKDAVYNMLSLGIMEGIGENFSPKGTYTKEQAITTIARLYNALSIGETQAQ